MGMDYENIYETYYLRVYGTALKITKNPCLAEDAAQETFLKAFLHLEKIHDFNKLSAWISKIASRTAIDILRKERKRILLPFDELIDINQEAVVCAQGSFREVEEIFCEKDIMDEINRLNPKLRTVFMMKYQLGMKESEIADELAVSASAVKSRAFRARTVLKEKIIKKDKRLKSA